MGSLERRLGSWKFFLVVFPLAIGYVVFLWNNPFDERVYAPDSDGYLAFSAHRAAGYPLFIDLIAAVSGTVNSVPAAQLLLAAAMFLFLAYAVHRAFNAPWLGVLVALGLFGNPELATYHATFLTESLCISLLCMMLGALVLLVNRPTATLAAFAASACGLAAMVRPAAISLVPIWPIVLWFIWNRSVVHRGRLAAAIIAPLIVCGFVEGQAWRAAHGDQDRPSIANLHLFAKALVMEPVSISAEDDLSKLLVVARERMQPARDFIANAPNWQVRLLLRTRIEGVGERQLFNEEITALADKLGTESNHLKGAIGRRAIVAAPWTWAKDALNYSVGLWALYEVVNTEQLHRYVAYVSQWDAPELIEIPRTTIQSRAAFVYQAVMVILFFVSTSAIALATWQRMRTPLVDDRLSIAAVSGLLVHGHFLFVGLFGKALARYSLAMTPCLVLLGVLAASYAYSVLVKTR